LTEPKLEGIDGGVAPGLVATGESDLDLQISYPIIYPQNSIIFQTDDLNYALGIEGGGGFLNTFFDAIDGSYCTYSAFSETVSLLSVSGRARDHLTEYRVT
jgi:tripeptidyl-peptidase-1